MPQVKMGLKTKINLTLGIVAAAAGILGLSALMSFELNRWVAAGAVVVGTGALAAMGYNLHRNVLRPLYRLSEISRQVGRGEYSAKLDVEVSDEEMREVVDSFNSMVEGIAEANQRTKAIINGVGAAVYVTDNDLRIIEFNPAAEKLLGYTRDEVVGKHCYDITHYVGVTPACHTKRCSSVTVMDGREDFIAREVVLRSKQGEDIPVMIYTSPLYNARGERIGAIKTAVDLREMKQKESDLLIMQEYLKNEISRFLPVIEAAAEGDMTQSIEATNPSDDIGKVITTFGRMRENLRSLILSVKSVAERVAATAEEQAASSEELNAASDEITSAVQ
ncbi:MAG: PAS domain-containing protein, partial [Euryarchaeota archaeon]|nr:PAS domain-containing protein [Euryarchaeota archaeon]